MFLEVNAYLSYNRLDEPLTFWRTRDQAEVDFIIGDHTAIEVKVSSNVSPRDQKNLLKLAEERPFKHLLVISGDPVPKRYETGVMCLPLTDFVDRLWSRALI